MKPRGTRQTLVVKGRQDGRVTIVVEVYRRKVWLTVVDVPFMAEGILEPGQADDVAAWLVAAAGEARGKQQPDRDKRAAHDAERRDATDGPDTYDELRCMGPGSGNEQ